MRTWRAEGASARAVEESSCRVCQDLGSDRSNQTQGPTVQFVFCSCTDQVLSVTIASAGHGNGRCRSRPVATHLTWGCSHHHDLACLWVPVHLGQAGEAREFEAGAAGALTWQRTPLGHPLEAPERRLAGGVESWLCHAYVRMYAYTHTTVTTYLCCCCYSPGHFVLREPSRAYLPEASAPQVQQPAPLIFGS